MSAETSLIKQATQARLHAHAPYSSFLVGAALEAEDGTVFMGCNVECSSFGGTICAERTALVSAVAQGVKRFSRLAIVTDTEQPTTPCGICRQLLHDFSPQMTVIMATLDGKVQQATLADLLPGAFVDTQFKP